jgi:predicted transcriptional regulator YdeE
METISLEHDIEVFCVTATSFPDGVLASHQTLHRLIPPSGSSRRYFGLSRPEDGGGIIYRAAAERLKGENNVHGLKTITIKKGEYIAAVIKNYLEDVTKIEKAFRELLEHPGLDPNGYCVEVYTSDKDVTCMIRLK